MWNEYNLKDKSSVVPILDLLSKRQICDYIHHICATREEFFYFIDKWTQKSINEKHPILYIACHGSKEKIYLNRKIYITLDELSEILYEKCYGKVIYFASCSTLNTHGKKIKSFLNKTNAIAAIGYTTDVFWLSSTACELLVFEALQNDKFDTKGIWKIHSNIFEDYGNLPKKVDLRMVINDKIHFARKRNTCR